MPRRFFKRRILYIQLRRSWLSVKVVGTAKVYENTTSIAIRGNTVIGVGEHLPTYQHHQGEDVTIRNGFDHPRMIISDPIIAQWTLFYFIRQVVGAWFRRPLVVLHLRDTYEGGLTVLEYQLLEAMCYACGAKEAYITTKPHELTDDELQESRLDSHAGALCREPKAEWIRLLWGGRR